MITIEQANKLAELTLVLFNPQETEYYLKRLPQGRIDEAIEKLEPIVARYKELVTQVDNGNLSVSLKLDWFRYEARDKIFGEIARNHIVNAIMTGAW